MSRYVASLDLGSSKIAMAVGEKTQDGVRIVSYHDVESAGMKCGEITNDLKVEKALRSLLDMAQDDIECDIEEVVVGISGKVLHCKDLHCESLRTHPDEHILEDEVEMLTKARYKASLGSDETVFEAVPQTYSIDDIIGVSGEELIGMKGSRLEASFKLFYGKKAILDNRRSVLDKVGLKMTKGILNPIASARAVLSAIEMENGAALVDIGKSSTEIAIVKDNVVRHLAVIPFGGESVTNDIKNVANITSDWAETVKIQHGCCCEEYTPDNKKLILKNSNNIIDGEIELCLLARIIEARMSEIFDAVRYIIDKEGYSTKLAGGVVLTGGCSHLSHVLQLAKAILGQKVRVAVPTGSIDQESVEEAFDAYSACAVGLVLEAMTPMLSHAIENKREVVQQRKIKNTVIEEEEPVIEQPAQKKPRTSFFDGIFGSSSISDEEKQKMEEEKKRKMEADRREREEKKRQEEQRKAEERKRKEEEKKRKDEEERKKRGQKGSDNTPSLFDFLFTDNNEA